MKITYLIVLFIACSFAVTAQVPVPAETQNTPIAIVHATAHLGNGKVIENALVTFDQGKITRVEPIGNTTPVLTGFTVIEATGQQLYPGLIAASSRVGIQGIKAIRQSDDYQELGELTPNVRALVAYDAESEVIPTLRFNGVLMAQSTPSGSFMAGSSSVMMLDAWNWEDAVYKADDGIHVYWPSKISAPRPWMGETEPKENLKYQSDIRELRDYLRDVNAYSGQPVNLKLAAGQGLIDSTKTLFIHVDEAQEIMNAVQICENAGVKRIVIVGGKDAWYVKDFLKENRIPVLLEGTHNLPSRIGEDVYMPYKLPFLLHKAGVNVGLFYSGWLYNARNLPFDAGTAAAYGLGKETALEMVSSNVAQILGIDKTCGTLEVGKDATMVLSEGDLLDMSTNNIIKAYIQGRDIDLEGRQQELYHRYRHKYGLE